MRTLRLVGLVLLVAVVAAAVSTIVLVLRRPADQVGRGPLATGGQGGGTLTAVQRALPSVVRVERGIPRPTAGASSTPGVLAAADTGGSGVVIDSRGYVLTAEVVVAGADSVSVAVPGGRTVAARVVGSDPPDALTLLKIDAPGLHALSSSGASPLDTGAGVVVLAAPPYAQVAVGAVASAHASASIQDPSDPGRQRPLNDLLTLDISARDGQLGAPLLDASGRLAGMVVAGGGQVFAVDMSQAQAPVQQLVDTGHASYPSLGFEYRQLSTTEAADRSVDGGVTVVSVTPAASQAGLAVGDLVVSANGTTLDPAHSLAHLLRGLAAHQSVDLAVAAPGGTRKVTLEVQLVSA